MDEGETLRNIHLPPIWCWFFNGFPGFLPPGEEEGFDPMGFSLAIDIRWLREVRMKSDTTGFHKEICQKIDGANEKSMNIPVKMDD